MHQQGIDSQGHDGSTNQDRSRITQIGINLEYGIILDRIIKAEEVGTKICFNSILARVHVISIGR